MRVLHIGKYFPPKHGGIETFMSQLMEEQAIQGEEVSALVHADVLQSNIKNYDWQGCKIFEVKSYGQLVFAPLAPSYPLRFISVLKQIKPDLVHVHMPNLSAFWILFFKGFLAKDTKIVIHWHSDVLGAAPTQLLRFFYPVYRLFEKCLLSISHSVIVTSPNYLATSIPLKKFVSKCHVIPLGIKITDSDTKIQLTEEAQPLKLTMLGRFSYYKGHNLVLKAIAELNKHTQMAVLTVIGGGLSDSLVTLSEQMNITKHVSWMGSVDSETKDHILATSDLLLLPSLERTEAFGVVLLEAANFKKCSLVSDVKGSGMTFVVDNHITGLVTKCGDVKDLADKLLFAVNNREALRTMGQNAHKKLQREYDIVVVTSAITKLYKDS